MKCTKPSRKAAPKRRHAVDLEMHASRFERVGDTHVLDHKLDLIWSHTLGRATFKDAQALVDKANADKLGGFNDWRMPTVEELFCLADRTRSSPAIDVAAFPDTKSDWYWTSTPYAPYSDYSWFVGFNDGGSGYGRHDYGYFVRAVRARQS